MLIISALVLLVAILLAVVALLWSRLRRLEQASQPVAKPAAPIIPPSPYAEFPKPASPVAPSPPATPPAPSGEAYDPDATKVHIRPPLEADHAVLRERRGATMDSLSHLVGLSGSYKGKKYSIIPSGITVGRSRTCDIVLADSRVSSHHAWIGLENGKTVLRDLESTNGTFLNAHTNESVSEAELVAGDTIIFGSHQGDQFRFVLG